MDAFKSRMALAGASNLVWCRAFPITLKKVELKWFNLLPSRSINRFSNLQSHFLAHFITQWFKPKLVTNLLGLSQRQGEPLQDFLERFNAKTLLVEELETQVAVLTPLNGLRPGAVKDSLSKRPAKIMDEIHLRAKRYIYVQEMQKATVNSIRNQTEKKSGLQQEDCSRKEARTPRVERFHNYTPFNVSLANLYKEVEQAEHFPKPKVLWVKANNNRSLFCEYHKGFDTRQKTATTSVIPRSSWLGKEGWPGTLSPNVAQGKEGHLPWGMKKENTLGLKGFENSREYKKIEKEWKQSRGPSTS